jgi:hypothetical protein
LTQSCNERGTDRDGGGGRSTLYEVEYVFHAAWKRPFGLKNSARRQDNQARANNAHFKWTLENTKAPTQTNLLETKEKQISRFWWSG